MRCSLPVAPFGISARKTIFRGTLKSARCFDTKSRISRSLASIPSRSTTAAPTSSPSIGCGIEKVSACATAGCSERMPSTSSGLTCSPPRLISSFNRPVSCR
jgi:hypothetical protein